jgi:hypothetical protein
VIVNVLIGKWPEYSQITVVREAVERGTRGACHFLWLWLVDIFLLIELVERRHLESVQNKNEYVVTFGGVGQRRFSRLPHQLTYIAWKTSAILSESARTGPGNVERNI